MKKIIGLFLAIGGITFAILLGGTAAYFINIPSILFILLVAGGLTLIKSCSISPEGSLLKHAKKYVIFSGLLSTFIGIMQLLHMIDEIENVKSFLYGLSVALLTTFYALIIGFIMDSYIKE